MTQHSFYISGKTKVCCLIGHPVSHTFNPIMHNASFKDLNLDFVYIAHDVHPKDLKKAVEGCRALNIAGFNVTIPHKEKILKYLDEVDPLAQKMGAINAVKNEKGSLMGRNTDGLGAKKALMDAGCEITGKNFLIIGAGGAARALCYVLAEEAGKIVLTDVIKKKALQLAKEVKKKMRVNVEGNTNTEETILKEMKNTDFLINATPLGMYPDIDASPVSKESLHKDVFVFDIIYNPVETKLIKEAKEIGCQTLGGLDMLVNQGVLAFEWWTGKEPNITLMKKEIIQFLGIK